MFCTRSRLGFIASAIAGGLVAATTSLTANSAAAPSLVEYITAICSEALRSSPPHEAPFLSDNVGAMTKMLVGMEIKPSGDVDYDFAAMMIPHHQGAIDMALAELRYGRNEQLRRMAQEIIVTQQQEIAAMRLAVGKAIPPSVPPPSEPSLQPALPSPLAR